MEGYIYIISLKEKTYKEVYIGQTYQPLGTRWRGHLRDAQVWQKKPSELKNAQHGKAAKLHRAISYFGSENMKIEILETHKHQYNNGLKNILNKRENHFIDYYDSIEHGWNKVKAPKTKLPLMKDVDASTYTEIANKHNLNVRSLYYQVNKRKKSIEEAIKYLKSKKPEPKLIYSYARQNFNSIRELSESKRFNPNKIDKNTIKNRIKVLKDSKKLEIKTNKEKNIKELFLPDSIFKKVDKSLTTVIAPNGEQLSDTIVNLHKKLILIYPGKVPKNYSTVQSRLNKPSWTPEQAFGFRLPPDLKEVERLILKEGYRWAVEAPSLKNKRNITKPVVLTSKKEIFISQTEFCDAYKLTDKKTIKKLFDAGKTTEEILEYYELKP